MFYNSTLQQLFKFIIFIIQYKSYKSIIFYNAAEVGDGNKKAPLISMEQQG